MLQCRGYEPQMRGHDRNTSCVTAGNLADHSRGKEEFPPKHPVHHGHFATIEAAFAGRGNGYAWVMFVSAIHKPDKRPAAAQSFIWCDMNLEQIPAAAQHTDSARTPGSAILGRWACGCARSSSR